jgi:hypothetical protein
MFYTVLFFLNDHPVEESVPNSSSQIVLQRTESLRENALRHRVIFSFVTKGGTVKSIYTLSFMFNSSYQEVFL